MPSHLRAFRPDSEPLYDAAMEPTCREIVAKYLQSSEVNQTHGAEALAERRRVLVRFADSQIGGKSIGDMPVSQCMPHFLTDWIESQPRWKSSSTRKGKANVVNACFNWAARGRRITENPFRGVNYEEAEPRGCLTDKTLAVLTDSCSRPFEELALYLRYVGRRLSEVCNMEWQHIDWHDGTVRVKKFKSRKKLKKDQTYVIVPEAVELLERIHRRQQTPQTGHVFLNNRGKPWTKGSAGQYLRRLKARLGISDKATLHGIRHQAITAIIKAGGSIKAAAQQAGHSDTRITESVYCHMEDAFEEMKAAVKLGLKSLGKDNPS